MAEPRGAVSGSPSERWRSICFGNQALSFCKIAPQPQNPGCEMKILLLAAPSCCLPPTAPRRPALTPSHLRRAQKKSRLRTSCEPLGLPPARASGLCRGLAGRVRGGVAGPRSATAAATPSTAGVASLTHLRQREHPFQLGGLPGPPPPLTRAKGCSSQGWGWERSVACTMDFISQPYPPDRDASIDIIISMVRVNVTPKSLRFFSLNRMNRASPGPDSNETALGRAHLPAFLTHKQTVLARLRRHVGRRRGGAPDTAAREH